MKPIITFVHVSDLHVGDSVPTLLTAPLEYFFGHDGRAARRLAWFYRHRRSATNAHLIVTGDLTSRGAVPQFELAADYLSDEALLQGGVPCGLGEIGWRDRAVSGNHDYWNGGIWPLLPMTPSPALAGTMGRAFPAIESMEVTIGGRTITVRFLAIDTDMNCTRYNRMMAHGAFEDQIYALETLLPEQPEPDEIRVLLLHHSLGYDGTVRLRIVDDSQHALKEFLADYDVRVMLCGHTHHPCVQKFPVSGREREGTVLEACCGTTLQRTRLRPDEYPEAGKKGNERIAHNALIVHTLYEEGREVKWVAETYVLGVSNFQSCSAIPALSSFPKLQDSISVLTL